jgi:ornithine carbamoyltransferase
MTNFIDLASWELNGVEDLLTRAEAIKRCRRTNFKPLTGKSVALYFEKPSLRTRVSFEIGIQELGGMTTYLDRMGVGLGVREPVRDVARTLDRYVDAIVCRLFRHEDLIDLAHWSRLSVVNALTDFSHPCQILADVMTLRECGLWREDLVLAWIGDPNNVLQSWIDLAEIFPMRIQIASPELPAAFERYLFEPSLRDRFIWMRDPARCVADADVVYGDTWISMGQENQAEEKRTAYQGYTISSQLLDAAPAHVTVLHCLPAKRGEEIDDDVFERFAPVIFAQAENRLHAQKAILWMLLAADVWPVAAYADEALLTV